ncbi:MAG: ParB/RepB/Spo0J family partition protein [Rhodoferax sp.]|nr:ParB/RepB/Spo0J family partition protein [Rhodoferax sp.]
MSLKEKASKIKFGSTSVAQNPALDPKATPKVKTAPGAMLSFANDQRSEMLKENEDLREKAVAAEVMKTRLDSVMQDIKQWEGAKATKQIDPKLISPSDWANRHIASFETQDFKDLVEEIASSGGNIQPIKVRPIAISDPQRYEIVFGHRRHRACLELGLPVLALIESIDDKALFVEMDRENRQREDLRPYEQGLMYRRALDKGLYPSLRALCEATGANLGNSSLVLRLAKVPEMVLDAFPSRLDIQYRWIQPMLGALDKNPDSLIDCAKEISKGRKSGTEILSSDVFARLINSVSSSEPKEALIPQEPQEIVVNGKTVAIIRKLKNRFVVEFAKDALPADKVHKLEGLLAKLLA